MPLRRLIGTVSTDRALTTVALPTPAMTRDTTKRPVGLQVFFLGVNTYPKYKNKYS
jgi:hypothetical protein